MFGEYLVLLRNGAGELVVYDAFNGFVGFGGPVSSGVDPRNEADQREHRAIRARVTSPIAGNERMTASSYVNGALRWQTTLNGRRPLAHIRPQGPFECDRTRAALVELSASQSTDADGDSLAYRWSAAGVTLSSLSARDVVGVFPLGDTAASLVVSDGALDSAPELLAVHVQDSTPPNINGVHDLTVQCSSPGGSPSSQAEISAFLSGQSAQDLCDPSPTLSRDAPSFFVRGVTEVHYAAGDESGNRTQSQARVTVQDTAPPRMTSALAVSPTVLWPPNHQLVSIAIPELHASDVCDANPRIYCSVASSEPPGVNGSGSTAFDIVLNGQEVRSQTTTRLTVHDRLPSDPCLTPSVRTGWYPKIEEARLPLQYALSVLVVMVVAAHGSAFALDGDAGAADDAQVSNAGAAANAPGADDRSGGAATSQPALPADLWPVLKYAIWAWAGVAVARTMLDAYRVHLQAKRPLHSEAAPEQPQKSSHIPVDGHVLASQLEQLSTQLKTLSEQVRAGGKSKS